MDIPATLIFITVLILVAAFIVRPFVASQAEKPVKPREQRSAAALRRRADLLATRNRVYQALRDLDFDHQTNKVADEEYNSRRHALVAEGVEILRQLDELAAVGATPEADPIEASVQALRRGEAAALPTEAAPQCSKCGGVVHPGDAFCGHCGASLKA